MPEAAAQISVFCKGCKRRLKAPARLLGKTVKCPGCAAPLTVQPAEVPVAVASPPPASAPSTPDLPDMPDLPGGLGRFSDVPTYSSAPAAPFPVKKAIMIAAGALGVIGLIVAVILYMAVKSTGVLDGKIVDGVLFSHDGPYKSLETIQIQSTRQHVVGDGRYEYQTLGAAKMFVISSPGDFFIWVRDAQGNLQTLKPLDSMRDRTVTALAVASGTRQPGPRKVVIGLEKNNRVTLTVVPPIKTASDSELALRIYTHVLEKRKPLLHEQQRQMAIGVTRCGRDYPEKAVKLLARIYSTCTDKYVRQDIGLAVCRLSRGKQVNYLQPSMKEGGAPALWVASTLMRMPNQTPETRKLVVDYFSSHARGDSRKPNLLRALRKVNPDYWLEVQRKILADSRHPYRVKAIAELSRSKSVPVELIKQVVVVAGTPFKDRKSFRLRREAFKALTVLDNRAALRLCTTWIRSGDKDSRLMAAKYVTCEGKDKPGAADAVKALVSYLETTRGAEHQQEWCFRYLEKSDKQASSRIKLKWLLEGTSAQKKLASSVISRSRVLPAETRTAILEALEKPKTVGDGEWQMLNLLRNRSRDDLAKVRAAWLQSKVPAREKAALTMLTWRYAAKPSAGEMAWVAQKLKSCRKLGKTEKELLKLLRAGDAAQYRALNLHWLKTGSDDLKTRAAMSFMSARGSKKDPEVAKVLADHLRAAQAWGKVEAIFRVVLNRLDPEESARIKPKFRKR
jgi:hypothetical protein